jgi:hypothetical protein
MRAVTDFLAESQVASHRPTFIDVMLLGTDGERVLQSQRAEQDWSIPSSK